MLKPNCLKFLNRWSFCDGFIFCSPSRLTQDLVKDAILAAKYQKNIDPEFCDALLCEEEYRGINDINYCLKDDFLIDPNDSIKFLGVPKRPLYREIFNRIEILLNNNDSNRISNDLFDPGKTLNPLLPASVFQLTELGQENFPSVDLLEKQMNKTTLVNWFTQIGSDGIFQLLGLRKSMGTIPALPPSWNELLKSAEKLHHCKGSKMTVAARARAKHAHRGGEKSYFGIAKGNVEQQNKDAAKIVREMLLHAAWINIHTFGGMEGQPVLEIRVKNGYGARWSGKWTPGQHFMKDIKFRGFLEPQMVNGHELNWKHV